MQLTFLGQTYEVHLPPVKVSETSETANFMGQSYPRRQYQLEQPPHPPAELMFMGQRYIRAETPQPLPNRPRPGEQRVDGRCTLQLQRSRAANKQHPAFRHP